MNVIKSFILFEFIITILLFTVILSYSANIILQINKKTITKNEQLNSILNLESTKIFLSKQKDILPNIKLIEDQLFFDNNLLLDKIKSLTINNSNGIITINIKLQNEIEQTWIIKYEQQ